MGTNMIQHSDFAICTVKYQMSYHSNSHNSKEYTYNFFLPCFTSVNKFCVAVPLERPNFPLCFQFADNLSMKTYRSQLQLYSRDKCQVKATLLLKTWQELVALDTELLTLGKILIH